MHAAVLRYLEAVAREGSIRKASVRLNISASAVNRQIQKLEDYFQTPLFERHPGGLRLTESGRLVLRHARETLQDFDRLKGEVDNLRGRVSGVVTISTLDSLTVQFLPEALAQFATAHPAVSIRALTCDPIETIQTVAQGEADLGLAFDPAPGSGVKVLHDIACGMCAIMPADHPLASRTSVALAECGDYPLIYQESSGSMRRFFGDEMDAFRSAHPPVLISNTMALIKRLILRGTGIAFYTRLGFTEELAAGRLAAVPLSDGRLPDLRLALIAPSDRAPTVAGDTMASHLRAALQALGSA